MSVGVRRLLQVLGVVAVALLAVAALRVVRGRHAAEARADAGPDFVGVASMEEDRTLVLRMSSFDPRVGGRVHGLIRYAPDDPRYAEILAHVGEIAPGQSKSIPPWP